MPQLNVLQPSSVTLMIKPVGALCNLDCRYCYYLPTKSVYDGHEHRMTPVVLESVYAGYLPGAADEVTICWQGGEPTLAGLKFFEQAITFQEQYKRPGQRVWNALQTNGTLLTDDWCRFLRKHQFLVGISVDGPRSFHDKYRVTNAGEGSHDLVMRGLRLLQQHDVEYNILCVLNAGNIDHPDEVFNHLLKLGSRWVQFIPEVVFEPDPDHPGENRLASHCPDPLKFGVFMTRVFDLWFDRYRQRVSERLFDSVLNQLVLGHMPLCILDGSCHGQVTIEHNGDVFGCDHFVERRWQLSRIGDPQWRNPVMPDGDEQIGLTIHGSGYAPNSQHAGRDIHDHADVERNYSQAAPAPGSHAPASPATAIADDTLDRTWFTRADAPRLSHFSARKLHLPQKCHDCEYFALCHGGCPEHRPHGGDRVEHTILCDGYIHFYDHCLERLEWLAGYLRRGQQPPPVQINVEAQAATDSQIGRRMPVPADTKAGRNDPCPCGSGLKFKNCCGNPRPRKAG